MSVRRVLKWIGLAVPLLLVAGFAVAWWRSDNDCAARARTRPNTPMRALEYCECQGDDLTHHGVAMFPRLVKLRKGETVWFSWILYKSKRERDRVLKKVMADPRLADMMQPDKMPFDMKRMSYGGFKVEVGLG